MSLLLSLIEDKNYITPKTANKLVIPESNIIEKLNYFGNKKYDITNLQLNMHITILSSNPMERAR